MRPWRGRSTTAMRCRPLGIAELAELPQAECCDSLPRLQRDPNWARAAIDTWGMCGLALTCDDEVTAYLLVTRGLSAPKWHPMSNPASAEAASLLLLTAMHPARAAESKRRLVQRLAAKLADRGGVTAIDTASSLTGSCCRPDEPWLADTGFAPLPLPHRWRLDVAAAVSWRSQPDQAWRRWVDAVLPGAPVRPLPSGRVTRAGQRSGADVVSDLVG